MSAAVIFRPSMLLAVPGSTCMSPLPTLFPPDSTPMMAATQAAGTPWRSDDSAISLTHWSIPPGHAVSGVSSPSMATEPSGRYCQRPDPPQLNDCQPLGTVPMV